jgi:lactate permease
MPPLVPKSQTENALFNFNLLSATGTGILAAAIASGFFMGHSVREMLAAYWRTLKLVRFSLLTIACMLRLGFVTRFLIGVSHGNSGLFLLIRKRSIAVELEVRAHE